jgi:hypothetical protein
VGLMRVLNYRSVCYFHVGTRKILTIACRVPTDINPQAAVVVAQTRERPQSSFPSLFENTNCALGQCCSKRERDFFSTIRGTTRTAQTGDDIQISSAVSLESILNWHYLNYR